MNLTVEQAFTVNLHLQILAGDPIFADMVVASIYESLSKDAIKELEFAAIGFVQLWDGTRTILKLLINYRTMPASICYAKNLNLLDELAIATRNIAAIERLRIEGSEGDWEVRWEGSDRPVLYSVGGAA